MAQELIFFILASVLWRFSSGALDPEVTHMDKLRGSSNGETYILVFGKDLEEDEKTAGNKVWLVSWKETVECPVNDEQSTSHKLNFHTPKLQDGTYSLKVQINGKILPEKKMCVRGKSTCRFHVSRTYTPTITSVEPRSGPPGTIVKVCGRLFTNRTQSTEEKSINGKTERIVRVYNGGSQCQLRIDGTDKLYGTELNPTTGVDGCFKCKLGGTFVGHHNISYIVDGQYGRSKALNTAMRVNAPDTLAMFETHAEVTSVSPTAGSTEGGTTLTIEGEHFDETTSPARVTVGGKPCKVKSLEDKKITCITPAMADQKTTYPGNRGFKLEIWKGTKLDFEDIDKVGTLQTSGATYSTMTLTSGEFYQNTAPYVTKMSGYFTPEVSGMHRFYFKANSFGKLYFSKTGLPKDKEVIATATHYSQFPGSSELDLKEGTPYYLEVHHSKPSGTNGRFQIGVRCDETQFNSFQTTDARNDVQDLQITSDESDEIQEVTFDQWPNAGTQINEIQSVALTGTGGYQLELDGMSTGLIDTADPLSNVQNALEDFPVVGAGKMTVSGSSSSYNVTFTGGRGKRRKLAVVPRGVTAGQVTVLQEGKSSMASIYLEHDGMTSTLPITPTSDVPEIEKAVLSVFSNKCPNHLTSPKATEAPFSQSYETDHACVKAGTIETGMAFCGRRSLKLLRNNPTKIDLDCDATLTKEDLHLEKFKYLCFASHGHLSSLIRVHFSYVQDTYRIGNLAVSLAGSKVQKVTVDGWEYRCLNLLEVVKPTLSSNPPVMFLKVLAIDVTRHNSHAESNVFVDDVQVYKELPFSVDDFELLATRRSSLKSHHNVKSVTAKRISSTTFSIQLKGYNCSNSFSLIQPYNSEPVGTATANAATFRQSSWPTAAVFKTERKLSAAPPVTGSFDLSYKGGKIRGISAQAGAYEVRQMLETADVGHLWVTKQGTCAGYKWRVVFNDGGGNRPQLTVLASSNLKGRNPKVATTKVDKGGVFLTPIPDSMFSTAHDKPQVVVHINGIPSRCPPGKCDFTWDTSSTATISSVSPIEGTKDTVLTIAGTGFQSDGAKNKVVIGSSICLVEAASGIEIQCKLGTGVFGKQPVDVVVSGKGKAKGDVSFTYKSQVIGVSPSKAGNGGGTLVTLTGNGLDSRHVVSIDQKTCKGQTASADGTQLQCEVPPSAKLGSVSLSVADPDSKAAHTTAFEYTKASSVITHVSVTKACVDGTTPITITGTGFGSSPKVVVGGKAAEVVTASDTSIKAVLPSLPSGSYPVELVSGTDGRADLLAKNIQNIEYEFEITSCRPSVLSALGGSTTECIGKGFPINKSVWKVKVGDLELKVTDVTSTSFKGVLASTIKTHKVTNDGNNKDHVIKNLAWSPKTLTIQQMDCVKWTWAARPWIVWPKWQVCETENPFSATCKDGGFKSEGPSNNGNYRKCFPKPGIFYYWSGWLNTQKTIGSYGKIDVIPPKTTWSADLSVTAAGQKPKLPSSPNRKKRATGSCDITSTSGTFTFTSSCSPDVSDITFTPNTDHYNVQVTGQQLGQPGLVVTLFLKDLPTAGGTGNTAQVKYYPTSSLQLCVSYSLRHVVSARTKVGGANILVPGTKTYQFKPQIHSCTPVTGSCAGVDLVCKGLHLLDAGSVSNVAGITVGGAQCKVSEVKNNLIKCRTPVLAAGTHAIAISFKTTCSVPNAALQFTCTTACTPSITAVSHSYTSGMDSLTITGDRLFTSGEIVDVSVGSTKCTPTSTTATSITCTLAKRIPGNNKVVVFRRSCGYSNVNQIVLKPSLTSITPDTGSLNGGLVVKATGIGFEGTLEVKLESSSKVLVTKFTKVSSTSIEFVTPVSASAAVYKVYVYSNSQKSIEDVQFTYDASTAWTPKLTSVTPNVIVPGVPSQATVSISGNGLHQTCSKNSVQLCHGGDTSKCCSCTISFTSTQTCGSQFDCEANKCPAGEYEVSVLVEGKGYATKVTGHKIKVNIHVTSLSPTEGSLAGGQIITLQGKGFSGVSTKVTVCGMECKVLDTAQYPATTTKISCKVPQTSGTAAKACDVEVQSGYLSAITASQQYTYSPTKTPTVASVSPAMGGTAGGTVITIKGDHFGTDATDLSVDIGGSACTIQPPATDTEIKCKTSSHPTSTLEPLVVTSNKYGLSAGNVQFNYAFYWSSPSSWPNGQLPKKGDFIVIDKKATMILDTDTPILKMLLVKGGKFILSDTKDINLNMENMLITDEGSLQIGTESNPFRHKATVTMHGHVRSIELPLYGAKSIGLRSGTIDIHGKSVSTTWTRLAATAASGANEIDVQHNVLDWPVGGDIVIATTGGRHSQQESEVHKIASVTNSGTGTGNRITLTAPLKYKHLGETKTAGGRKLEIRAEVGLISRNIVFRGNNDPQWNTAIKACPKGFDTGQFKTQTCFQGRFGEEMGSDQFGAHILIHAADDGQGGRASVTARFSYMELNYVGQAFRLGRYPIHFHLNGKQEGSYVKGCSFWKTFNRAVNIHGTHGILVEGNVLYNVMGGALFLEDGVETKNTFKGNLGVFLRSSTSLLNEDITPAFIWATNPNNIIRDNAAAGGTHFGYWYRMNKHPDGPSFDPNICPRNVPLGVFSNNTAHSFGWFGIWIFPTYTPMIGGRCGTATPAVATFENFQAWHCEKGAEAVNVGSIRFKKFVTYLNELAGIEMKLVLGNNEAKVLDSHIVGSLPGFSTSRGGLTLPFSSGFSAEGVTFSNFDQAKSYAIRVARIDGKCTELCGAWSYSFSKTTWDNSPNKAAFDWVHEGVLHDMDGTLTMLTGTSGMSVLPKTGLLNPSKCRDMPDFSTSVIKASGCDSSVRFYRFAFNGALPTSLYYKDVTLSNKFGTAKVPFKQKALTHAFGWTAVLPVDDQNPTGMEFANSNQLTNISYTGKIYGLGPTDSVIISHKFTQFPDRFAIIPGQNAPSSTRMVSFNNNNNGDYYFDKPTKTLYYLISGRRQQTTSTPVARDIALRVYRCFTLNCKPVNNGQPTLTPPTNQDYWSDPNTWQTCGSNPWPCLPKDGDDVTIPAGQLVWVDARHTLPKFGKIYIYGWLEFITDTSNEHIIFRATHIIVMPGGKLLAHSTSGVVGTLKGRLTIELLGDHSTPEVKLQGAPNVGSKVMAIFGDIDLHGAPRTNWTRLAKTAKKGDTSIEIAVSNHDWKAGDEIVVTSTSFRTSETETFRITAVSGSTLTLNTSLAYDHRVTKVTSAKLKSSNKEFTLAAEVGCLTRTITIAGSVYPAMDKQAFGARVLIGAALSSTGSLSYGQGRFANVRFHHCGQLGWSESYDARYALSWQNTGNANGRSYVVGSAFDNAFSTAIGVYGANGVKVADNVLYRTVGSGMIAEGKENTVSNNLVTNVIWAGHYNGRYESYNVDWPVGIQVNRADDVTLKDNVVAGSDRLGYRIKGEACGTPTKYGNNEVHSALIGSAQFPGDEQKGCTRISGFKAWRNFDFGIYSQTESNMEVSGVLVISNGVGILNIVNKPPMLGHTCVEKTVTIKDSVIGGDTSGLNCFDSHANDDNFILSEQGRSWTVGLEQLGGYTGIGWPSFLSKSNKAPTKKFKGAMSYPALCGHTLVKDTMFYNFKREQCSSEWRRNYVFSSNPSQEDHLHTMTVQGAILDEVEEDSKIFIHRPNKKFINPSDCVDMDCDGKKKCLLRDNDCSFIGGSGKCAVIPEAEFEWDGDPVHGVGDYRIPKAALTDKYGAAVPAAIAYPKKGVYRDNSCQKMTTWQAYKCRGSLAHAQMVIESMDSDSETRRLSPVAILSDTGPVSDEFVDLLNGPMDHGWCSGYTCQKRISTFWPLIVLGKSFKIFFSSTSPQKLRLRLLDVSATDSIKLAIFYKTQQRLDVYVGDNRVLVDPTNVKVNEKNQKVYISSGIQEPKLMDPAGTNLFDRETQMLTVILKGKKIVQIEISDSIVVGFRMAPMTIAQFYGTNIIRNLAAFLGIPVGAIKVVKATGTVNVRRRRRSTGVMKVTIEISKNEGSQVELTLASDKLIDLVQTGRTSIVLNCTIYTVIVSPPPPKPGSPGYASYISHMNKRPPGTPPPVMVPNSLVFERQPVASTEGEPFKIQPWLRFTDSQGKPLDSVGTATTKWVVSATLRSKSTDPHAKLLGVSEATFQDGIAKFTDLQIPHYGDGYIIDFTLTAPKLSKTNTIASRPLRVLQRRLKLVMPKTTTYHEEGGTFDLKLKIADSQDKKATVNLGWKGHKWSASIALHSKAKHLGKLNGPKEGRIDLKSNEITFTGLSLSKRGSYALVVQLVSNPAGYSAKVILSIRVSNVTKKGLKKECKIRFKNDYSVVAGDVEAFCTTVENDMTAKYSKINFDGCKATKGSIVVTFQVEGTEGDLNAFLKNFYAGLNGYTVSFNGNTMKSDGTLSVDGKVYTPTDEKPDTVISRDIIIAAVCIFGGVMIIVGVAVHCAKKKKKNKLDLERKRSESGTPARNLQSPIGDDKITVNWDWEPPPPSYGASPLTPPPAYKEQTEERSGSSVSAIYGQIIPRPRHGLEKHAGHMSSTAIRRISANKSPNELRTSENITLVE